MKVIEVKILVEALSSKKFVCTKIPLIGRLISILHHIRGSLVNLMMEMQHSTFRLLLFHGIGKDDNKQHLFTCEVVCVVKQTTNDVTKITQLDTTFQD